MKTLDPSAVTLLAGRKPILAGAMTAFFGSGTYRLWSGSHPLPGDIVGDTGQTFKPISDRALIAPYSSSIGGAADSLTITLSGIDPDIAATIEAEDYQQKPVIVYRIVFADEATPVGYMTIMRGRCDFVMQRETVGGKCALDFAIEGPRRDMSRSGARILSDTDQRTLGGALDGACRHVTVAGKKTLYWGNAPGVAKDGGGGGLSPLLQQVKNKVQGVIG